MHKTIAGLLLFCSFNIYADYSNFAWSVSDTKGNRVYDTNNVIKAAIEHDNFISLSYDAKFESAAPDLFKQINALGKFELDAFASPVLINGIRQLIGEFACATYRFEAQKGQARTCNGLVIDKDAKEGKPFQSGQFVDNRLEISVNSIRPNMPNRSYDIYLPSAKEVSLEYTWGAVHEMGSFFVRQRDRKDTVLTVYIDGYKLDTNGERGTRITNRPEIIFVVIPSVAKIGKQSNQDHASAYAIANADIIVPRY
ncbi:hypothetical protein BIY21_11495 [Vibrio ponticus]|uniref:Uncharacterized protein n=1 Tax=Vibrio ponticus TaxID=265668 RepID=A0ABX3FLF3_9VIBR|nr:hypothetical protein [Vibrio ponticus]OLQ92879.1 hypothetical protein BIY21_11495 [Vibrio ponticus]